MKKIKKKIVALTAILMISISMVSFAEKTIDQKIADLEKKLPTVSGKEKIEVLNELAYEYKYQSTEKCIKYANHALNLSQKLNHRKGEAAALKIVGVGYRLIGNKNRALECIQKALKIFENLGDKKNSADSIKEIGLIYLDINKYDTALEYFFNSLRIAKEISYKKGISNSLNNIGAVYIFLKKFDKALEYYEKALQIDEELGDKRGAVVSLFNIAQTKMLLSDGDSALKQYMKITEIYEELGDKEGLADSYLNLGILYGENDELKDYKKSEDYFLKSLKIEEEIGKKIQIARLLCNLGEIYSRQKQYDKALIYLKKGLNCAKEIEAKIVVRTIFINFSDLYSGMGEYKKALEYHKLYFEANEEILNEKSSKQIAEMQTRFETLEKEKKIELLEKNSEIQQLRLSREKITKYAFISGFILVLIIAVLLFRKYLYLFSFWKKQKYISQFRLMEEIGTGGMGIIYKAHSIRDKTDTAAIKVLKPELFKDETSRKRFRQEAAIIDKLEHPNIVEIIERGEYKEKLFIAMELLQGKTLDVKIDEEGQIDLDECFHIMMQISDALVLIHSKEIIHRDLKPSNIMLVEKDGVPNFVKLLDFGLARMKFQTRITRTGVLMGTLNYMSPEQLAHSEFSLSSDVYSLGVTFYEMVTGKIAFPGDTANEIMKQVLDTTPIEPRRFRPDIPGELNDLIMKMLEKDKESRPVIKDVLLLLCKMH
jgi:tetratricopeptide (TPR) repeat protein/tRNA A-37 threonylcarbamoyl transferase component Bud32